MHDMRRTLLFLMLTVVSIPLFAQGGAEQVSAKGVITAYISGPSEMIDKLEMEFEKDRGDVLSIVHMGCGPLRQRVWAELGSGGIAADVIWGSDPLLYYALDAREALVACTPEEAQALAPEYVTDRDFINVSDRYGVIIYNKDYFAGREPESFLDLLDPVCNGLLVHADPSQSSTALALIAGGWNLTGTPGAYHKQLTENGLFLARKNSDVPSKIQEGEFNAGIAPHDAVYRLQMKAAKEGYPTPLAYAWPKEGSLAIQRPVAISMKPARAEADTEIAREFVNFLISRQAQMIMSSFGFISTRVDVAKPEGIPETIDTIPIDWEQLSEDQKSIEKEFRSFFD
jgi:iron(III) transport system substrate-binding protein